MPGLDKLLNDGSPIAHPPLRRLLTDGIRHWMDHGTSDFSVDLSTYPDHMQEAICTIVREHAQIGWDNAIHGLLSKAWVDLASLSSNETPGHLKKANFG